MIITKTMKARPSRWNISLLILLGIYSLGVPHACAAVISNAAGISQFEPAQSGPLGSDAEVGHSSLACGGWGQFLALEADGKLRMVTGTLGSVFGWYTIAQGERLDAAYVLGNPPFGIRGSHSVFFGDIITPEADGTWLFGWWSQDRNFNYEPGPNDCYGWLRLGVRNGKLAILEDAAEVGGAGIYAGTLIAVPEPSISAVIACGFVLIFMRRVGCRRLLSLPQ